MTKEIINWGIIGCGDVAEVKSGPAFQKTENSALYAVMRRNEDKVKDFARRHHVAHFYTDASVLINDKNINAVYIATPPSTHLQYALEVLATGKDVYLEKPMVLNSIEAVILSNAVAKGKSKVTVAHYRRCLPVFLKVKELLDSATIGEISHAEISIRQSKNASLIAKTDVNWRINPEISGGGYFHDIAPHQIDLMYNYFGEINHVEPIHLKEDENVHSCVSGAIQFKNGVQFKGTWDFDAPEGKEQDNCTIFGEKGSISFSFYGEEILVTVDGK